MPHSMLESKFFRVAVRVFWLALIMAAIAAAGLSLKWRSCAKADAAPEPLPGLSARLEGVPAKLADTVEAKAAFKCPWDKRPGEISATPGAGAQLCDTPRAKLKSIHWGSCVYEISAKLQPYRVGETGEGSMKVGFSSSKGTPRSFDLKIPPFKVEPVAAGAEGELSIAGKIPISGKGRWKWIAAGALLAALLAGGACAIYFSRRGAKAALPQPPWTLALAAISTLKSRLDSGVESADACVAELSDIVRGYLEGRFSLRAGRQTTSEFLSDLERGDGPLEGGHRSFLKDFLSAADMVKFARLPADKPLLDGAIQKAERLVVETRPKEEGTGG